MPCERNSSCQSGILVISTGSVLASQEPETSSNHSLGVVLPLGRTEALAVLCLAAAVAFGNLSTLFLTKFASGGESPAMVFVRMLCISDFLIGCYGVGKMVMVLYLDILLINFFLPESLLFTANTAACVTLLMLTVDRSAKIAAPFWYTQHLDKASVITGMVFVWNASFVIGFLPLLGWNRAPKYVLGFFDFFPWHYLLFVGLCWLLCVSGSLGMLVFMRQRFGLVNSIGECRMWYPALDVEKYQKLQMTILAEIVTWLLCYLPFFIFVLVSCQPQPLLSTLQVNRSVQYFTPVFLLRSLAGTGFQIYRTVYIQGLVKNQSSSPSTTPRHNFFDKYNRQKNGHGIATISYSNPMFENSVTDVSILDSSRDSLQSLQTPDITRVISRPQRELDVGLNVVGVTDEITAL